MFPERLFSYRMFPQRFFPKHGSAVVLVPSGKHRFVPTTENRTYAPDTETRAYQPEV